jgi:1-deoxy-D-xylulose-5-phosphate reductoisomerase
MRLPILYAMAYPERLRTGGAPMDLFQTRELTFERPDEERFPSLRLAAECIKAGGAACCVLNAANEEAVGQLLQGKLTVGRLYRTVEETLRRVGHLPAETLPEVLEADRMARGTVRALMKEEPGEGNR